MGKIFNDPKNRIQAKSVPALPAPARRTIAAGAAVLCLLIGLEARAQESIQSENGPRLPFFVTSYAEAYYGVDFNNLDIRKKPPFFVSYTKNDEPALNLGVIKGSYAGPNARVNLGFALGSYVRANYAAEPEVLRHLYEANVGVKLPGKHNLWLDAGVIPWHIGFESAIGKDNWTLTRSMGADNTSYYETGARVGYTSTDEKWFVSGLILNGWQHIKPVPGNSLPAFGTQVTYKPSSRILLNSSTFIGSDKPDDNRRTRYFHNRWSAGTL